MAVIHELRFDGLTDGATITPTAPWARVGTAPTATTSDPIHGTGACRWASTATNGYIEYNAGVGGITAARVFSFYFKIVTLASADHTLSSASDGSSWNDSVRLNNNDTVSLIGVTTTTSTETLSAGVVYRAEWRFDPVGDTIEIRFFQGEGTTALFTLSQAGWNRANARYFTVGPSPTAGAGGSIIYDTLKFADDWTGPESAEDPEDPEDPSPPRVIVRRFSGSVWE